jgi:hypothetical protein
VGASKVSAATKRFVKSAATLKRDLCIDILYSREDKLELFVCKPENGIRGRERG